MPAFALAPTAASFSASAVLPARRLRKPPSPLLQRRQAARARPAQRHGAVAVRSELLSFLSVPSVVRMLLAGVVLYSSANYVAYRGIIKNTEEVLKERESKAEARRAAVDRLGPRSGGSGEKQPQQDEEGGQE